MFHRIFDLFRLRQSTNFLLLRADDHLLDDIGLTRHDLEELRQGRPHKRSRHATHYAGETARPEVPAAFAFAMLRGAVK